MKAEKEQYRQQAQAQRQGQELPAISERMQAHLLAWPNWREATRILAYTPFRGEVDLLSLGRLPTAAPWALPMTLRSGTLEFHLHSFEQPLQVGRYGILEPAFSKNPIVTPDAGDIILVPGLLFDAFGYRLGYGKGYYDRFLSQPGAEKACFVGVNTLDVLSNALPRDLWDVPMHWLLSVEGLVQVS